MKQWIVQRLRETATLSLVLAIILVMIGTGYLLLTALSNELNRYYIEHRM